MSRLSLNTGALHADEVMDAEDLIPLAETAAFANYRLSKSRGLEGLFGTEEVEYVLGIPLRIHLM